MFNFLKNLRACFGLSLVGFLTLLTGFCIFILTPIKLILRLFGLDKKIIPLMRLPFHLWYRSLHFWFGLLTTTKIELVLPEEGLDPSDSSLLIANHQSWLDIGIILSALRNHLPSATFFLKKELLFVPFIGSAAWAMDMIFVNRYKKKQLIDNPKLKGQDLEIARLKCLKLEDYPNTVINFVEGTRFTLDKHNKRKQGLEHLLDAKAGGVNFTLNAMQSKFKHLLNVIIIYDRPREANIVWSFYRGDIPRIHIFVEKIDLEARLFGDYNEDIEYRKSFQSYINQLWQKNDQYIKRFFDPNTTEQQPHQ